MKKTRLRTDRGSLRLDVLTAVLLFGLIMIRYCYYGLTYYIQLDDYIQYHNFNAFYPDWLGHLVALGSFSARPLAGLTDVHVWGRFWGNMIVAVAILSAMYAVSGVLLHAVFRRRFGTGYVFYVVYALLPLGFEGSYWISASSRILTGLFFAALSLLFFDRWCMRGKKRELVLFAVFQFIAFCYYEQIVLFSVAATLVVMLAVPKSERSRAQGGWLFLVGGLAYFAVTKLAPAGVCSDRAQLFLPTKEDYDISVAEPAWRQVKEVFLQGGAATLGRGFRRGASLIAAQPNFIYILLVLGLCVSFFAAARTARRTSVRLFAELLAGVFLTVAPLAVFFVISSPWIGLRNAVPSFCGLALIADALCDLVFGRMRGGAKKTAFLAALLAGLCCVSSVSELYDYRAVTQGDTRVCSAAAEAIADLSAPVGEKRGVWLLNVEPTYAADANYYYHEHDYGVTSSTWATTGAVAAIANRRSVGENFAIRPITANSPYEASNEEIASKTFYWFGGGSFTRVSLTPNGAGWTVNAAGKTYGSFIRDEKGELYLKLA